MFRLCAPYAVLSVISVLDLSGPGHRQAFQGEKDITIKLLSSADGLAWTPSMAPMTIFTLFLMPHWTKTPSHGLSPSLLYWLSSALPSPLSSCSIWGERSQSFSRDLSFFPLSWWLDLQLKSPLQKSWFLLGELGVVLELVLVCHQQQSTSRNVQVLSWEVD